jgi:hypothetical protein
MMEAVRTSETSVDNHFTRQYNPEDSSEHDDDDDDNDEEWDGTSSQYLHGQYRTTQTHIHASNGIRTDDPSVRGAKAHASDHAATAIRPFPLFLMKRKLFIHAFSRNTSVA